MLTDAQRQAAADVLLQAERTRVPCVQPSRQWPGMDLEDAYDVQRRWAEARIAQGARIVGRKIGLTSRAMQMASKMTEPDYGVILDDALFRDGARIAAGRFIKPRLETELADAPSPQIRQALERTLANRRQQLVTLEDLHNTTRWAEVKVENTVSILGALYSQALMSQSTGQVADFRRLLADIEEEARALDDYVTTLAEVKLGTPAGPVATLDPTPA